VDQLVASHLIGEARAAIAKDAAFAVEQHELADRDRLLEVALGLDVTALARPMRERLILERALAALVAHRAVERMVGEQQLDHAFLSPLGGRRVGLDLHVGRDREHARRLQHRTAAGVDLDHALAAHADRLHAGVVAELRHVDACPLGGGDDQLALARRERHAVDRDGNGVGVGLGRGGVGIRSGGIGHQSPATAITGISGRVSRFVTRAANSSGNSVIAEWIGT
jgi:hypothetical protein